MNERLEFLKFNYIISYMSYALHSILFRVYKQIIIFDDEINKFRYV